MRWGEGGIHGGRMISRRSLSPGAAPASVSYRVRSTVAVPESFTPEEAAALAPCFGNADSPVFALTNLPEVVKGALFARYSRSAKSVRRLFLDEFLGDAGGADHGQTGPGPGRERAERLYRRVFDEYGDDSVAQLGGAHLACEGVSNVLTKILERGRLMAYLEQSTRYVPYTDRPGGLWKYVVPGELEDAADRAAFVAALDRAFETYARWIEPVQQHFRRIHRQAAGDSDAVYRAVIRAKALDTLRGLLPAATRSNVGIYGSGQAYEALLLRMRAHPLAESPRGGRSDALRAQEGHPGLPAAGRSSGSGRPLERLPERPREGDRGAGTLGRRRVRRHAGRRVAGRSHAHRVRSGR